MPEISWRFIEARVIPSPCLTVLPDVDGMWQSWHILPAAACGLTFHSL
jgi:hypothetical protein